MPRRKKSKTKSGEGGVAGSANVQVVKAPEDGRRRQPTIATSVTAFSLVAVVLGVFAPLEWREGVVGRWREVVSFANYGHGLKPDLSLNVSSCPGASFLLHLMLSACEVYLDVLRRILVDVRAGYSHWLNRETATCRGTM